MKPRYVKTGACRACYDKARVRKRPILGERARAKARRYGRRYYRQWKDRITAKHREQYTSLPPAAKTEQAFRRHYGIDLAHYDMLLAEQGGCCAICRRPPKRKRLVVDHDHVTGAVRGLLCVGCNIALGHLGDGAYLQSAGDYLARSRIGPINLNEQLRAVGVAVRYHRYHPVERAGMKAVHETLKQLKADREGTTVPR